MADELNFQVQAEGFGSYLNGILPDDIATSAGAFSASMQQVRNVLSVDFEKFAQVVYSTEVVNTGLNLVNGSDIPTNINEANQGHNRTALGSGPYGTYTMSDFFGCMSGLPYMWSDIYNGVKTLQTQKLKIIYQQIYLAVKWQAATATATVAEGQVTLNSTFNGVDYDYFYTITGATLVNKGGGYGRNSASAPTASEPNTGATFITTIGINPDNFNEYGKVLTLVLTSSGTSYNYGNGPSATPPNPGTIVIEIKTPPTDYIAYPYSGGSGNQNYGTLGWPTALNTVLYNGTSASLIKDANVEIANIRTLNPYLTNQLNIVYDAAGKQLKTEQRARFTGISPVPLPDRDDFINIYPTALSVFTDAVTQLAQNTNPHMYAQTLEAISNINTVGGQSVVGLMRQERNAARLQEIGIELDNNISGEFDPEVEKLLVANGTVPVAEEGIDITGVNGDPEDPVTTYTVPSNLLQEVDGVVVSPKPLGYYDPNDIQYKTVQGTSQLGQSSPIQQILSLQNNNTNNRNLLGPAGNGTGPAVPILVTGQQGFNNPSVPALATSIPGPNSINPKPNQVPLSLQTGVTNLGTSPLSTPNPFGDTNPSSATTPTLNPNNQQSIVSTQTLQPIAVVSAGPQLPLGVGTPIDTGKAVTPGSLASSKAVNLLPVNLNTAYTSNTLLPSTLTVQEAIDEVILCNCDCWVD